MKDLIKRIYKGFEIEFQETENGLMANATSMAKAFPKKNLSDWTSSQETTDYIEVLRRKNLIIENPIIKNVGRYGGTWIHERLILKLAGFLDTEFEVQCDDWVSELLRTGKVELQQIKIPTYPEVLRNLAEYTFNTIIDNCYNVCIFIDVSYK